MQRLFFGEISKIGFLRGSTQIFLSTSLFACNPCDSFSFLCNSATPQLAWLHQHRKSTVPIPLVVSMWKETSRQYCLTLFVVSQCPTYTTSPLVFCNVQLVILVQWLFVCTVKLKHNPAHLFAAFARLHHVLVSTSFRWKHDGAY